MVKLLPASGEQLVGVALMPHVEYDLILRRFQYTVQRDVYKRQGAEETKNALCQN